jgi:hypothetical protein
VEQGLRQYVSALSLQLETGILKRDDFCLCEIGAACNELDIKERKLVVNPLTLGSGHAP